MTNKINSLPAIDGGSVSNGNHTNGSRDVSTCESNSTVGNSNKLLTHLRQSLGSVFTWQSERTESVVTDRVNYSEDENKDRGNWSGRLDFILSCLGFAVGLGNVWRFPYLCYRNGGGAFLVPYTLMLLLAGLPMFFMELVLGQFSSRGPIGVWNLSPLFRGLGYGMCVISGMVCIYYNVLIAYVVRYFLASFTSRVPWATCGNPWNTPACSEDGNQTLTDIDTNVKLKYPAEEYWERYILEMSPGIDHPGQLKWDLCLCLLGAWIVVFLCLIKGIKSSGKVVYFTAIFPYVVLFILFIRGVTLPGAANGIKFYIVPDWKKLKSAKVWGDAAVQIFYSLGPAWGGLIVMSSYNRFHNNCYRDALFVAISNCATSVFAGFVIFSVIGFMAHKLNLPIDQVTDSGPGLAFVAYPAGIAMMPGAPFWAILFFFMLFTLGLDSMFVMMETIITSLADEFPKYCRTHKTFMTAVLSILFFMLGLPQCTQAGVYWMNLLDWYSASFGILVIAFVEILVIMHVYGCDRFCDAVEQMLGFRPNIYWRLTWQVISPLAILFIIVFNAWMYVPVTYNAYTYPKWAEVLGWLMVVAPVLCILGVAAVGWWQYIGGFMELIWYLRPPYTGETLKALTQPTSDWGPALKEHWVYRQKDVSTQTLDTDLVYSKHMYDNPGYEDTKSNLSYETHI